MGIAVHLAVACDVYDGVFLCCPFPPRDVLDEILSLIESVSEVFLPTLAISVSPHVCFIFVLILISMFLR